MKYKVMLEFTVQRHHIVEAENEAEAENLAYIGKGHIDHDDDWSYNNYSLVRESAGEA